MTLDEKALHCARELLEVERARFDAQLETHKARKSNGHGKPTNGHGPSARSLSGLVLVVDGRVGMAEALAARLGEALPDARFLGLAKAPEAVARLARGDVLALIVHADESDAEAVVRSTRRPALLFGRRPALLATFAVACDADGWFAEDAPLSSIVWQVRRLFACVACRSRSRPTSGVHCRVANCDGLEEAG